MVLTKWPDKLEEQEEKEKELIEYEKNIKKRLMYLYCVFIKMEAIKKVS